MADQSIPIPDDLSPHDVMQLAQEFQEARGADAVEDQDIAKAIAHLRAQQGPTPDVAGDKVGEASWESFPASDAPGWIKGTDKEGH